MRKSYLVIFLACLLFPAAVWATKYYVDPAIGDNSNPGYPESQAFRTLTYALTQLQAGDTLYIRHGDYLTENITIAGGTHNSGTEGLPITVKSYNGEFPNINTMKFRVRDVSYWVFDNLLFDYNENKALPKVILGLFIDNYPEPPIFNTAENITFQNCTFQHGTKAGIIIACAENIKIINNVFDNIRSRAVGSDCPAISLKYKSNNIKISGNQFSDIGSDGVHFSDKTYAEHIDIIIKENDFWINRPYQYRDASGLIAVDPGFGNVGENAIDIKKGPGPIIISGNNAQGFRPTYEGQDASGASGVALSIHNEAYHLIIEKNHFNDNSIHIVIQEGSCGDEYCDRNCKIEYNLFGKLGPSEPKVPTPAAVSIRKASQIYFYNNTIYDAYSTNFEVLRLSTVKDLEVINNILCNGTFYAGGANQNNTISYNVWSNVTNSPYDEDSIYSDPLFQNSEEGNFHLQYNSPCINEGTDVGLIEDFDGTPVPQGDYPDIGAFEYVD